jgi:hypothetical protein
VTRVLRATPAARRPRAVRVVRRMPARWYNAPANGPSSPYSRMLTDTAREIVERSQPNSRSRGTMSTLGVARTPAAASSARKVTPRTIQA